MQNSTEKTKAKGNAFLEFIYRHKFVSSLILCLLFFLIYLPFNGFRIYSGGDDSGICNLISNGEIGISFIGYFFAWFVSLFQPLFPHINFYFVLHEIICYFSLAAINYLFLSKLSAGKGLLSCVVFDALYFSIFLICIQFTNTAAIACTAGFLCIVNGCACEKIKKYRISQIIGGLFLLLTGSQVRFDPFKSLFAVAAAFILGVFLADFFNNKKGISIGEAFKISFKKYIKTAVVLISAAAIVFSANIISDALKNTQEGYKEFSNYNIQLAKVNDYKTPNYYMNREFYNKLGIKSYFDINILKMWCVDDDLFTADKLNVIGEYAKTNANNGEGNGATFERLFSFVQKDFSDIVKSGMIIVYAVVFVVLVFVIWILWLTAKEQLKRALPAIGFLALWGLFFAIMGVRDDNLLAIPIAVFTIVTPLLYNKYQQIINLLISLAAISLYVFLSLSRVHFNATLCIFIPAFAIMLYGLNDSYLKSSDSKKHPKLLVRIISAILVITSLATAAPVYAFSSYAPYPDDYKQVEHYIKEHKDNLFIEDGIYRSDSDFRPLVKNEKPKNIIGFGGWDKKSRTYQNSLKSHGIKHLFKDLIDSDIIIVFYEYLKNKNTIDNKKTQFEIYLTEQYAPKGKHVVLKKVKDFDHYFMYKAVTEKNPKVNKSK